MDFGSILAGAATEDVKLYNEANSTALAIKLASAQTENQIRIAEQAQQAKMKEFKLEQYATRSEIDAGQAAMEKAFGKGSFTVPQGVNISREGLGKIMDMAGKQMALNIVPRPDKDIAHFNSVFGYQDGKQQLDQHGNMYGLPQMFDDGRANTITAASSAVGLLKEVARTRKHLDTGQLGVAKEKLMGTIGAQDARLGEFKTAAESAQRNIAMISGGLKETSLPAKDAVQYDPYSLLKQNDKQFGDTIGNTSVAVYYSMAKAKMPKDKIAQYSQIDQDTLSELNRRYDQGGLPAISDTIYYNGKAESYSQLKSYADSKNTNKPRPPMVHPNK